MRSIMKRFFVLLSLSWCLIYATGCDMFKQPVETLTVLAGSELKDLQPYFDNIRNNARVDLQMEYTGTLDGAEKLAGGAIYDLAWFSHGKYLSLLPETKGGIYAQEKIMLSPVVLGIKESKVKEWGWHGKKDIRWSDIADKAAAGNLKFAMTNPAASNSGFTALLGVAAAFSKTSGAVTSKDINKEQLKRFFAGQKLTSGSSGWLAEAYIREQVNLDGLINYESVLMSLNSSGRLKQKLVLIYPTEGIVTADYPLMLLSKNKREQYDRLVAYLKSEAFQKLVMDETGRRPVIPQVKLNGNFGGGMLVELPFPGDRNTIDSLIYSYLDEVRLPSSPIFVLDVSGSMKNQRIDNLRQALKNLTGLDKTLTGKFARFREREDLHLLPFNHQTSPLKTITIHSGDTVSESMQEVRQFVDSLQADGGTAIYAALIKAYMFASERQKLHPDRFYSVVLLSDGKNEAKTGYQDFKAYYDKQPEEVRSIKTFTILFGNSNVEEMSQIAELTGGRVFDGQQKSLAAVFKKIRGYQ